MLRRQVGRHERRQSFGRPPGRVGDEWVLAVGDGTGDGLGDSRAAVEARGLDGRSDCKSLAEPRAHERLVLVARKIDGRRARAQGGEAPRFQHEVRRRAQLARQARRGVGHRRSAGEQRRELSRDWWRRRRRRVQLVRSRVSGEVDRPRPHRVRAPEAEAGQRAGAYLVRD
jgi:hypothetical protein